MLVAGKCIQWNRRAGETMVWWPDGARVLGTPSHRSVHASTLSDSCHFRKSCSSSAASHRRCYELHTINVVRCSAKHITPKNDTTIGGDAEMLERIGAPLHCRRYDSSFVGPCWEGRKGVNLLQISGSADRRCNGASTPLGRWFEKSLGCTRTVLNYYTYKYRVHRNTITFGWIVKQICIKLIALLTKNWRFLTKNWRFLMSSHWCLL